MIEILHYLKDHKLWELWYKLWYSGFISSTVVLEELFQDLAALRRNVLEIAQPLLSTDLGLCLPLLPHLAGLQAHERLCTHEPHDPATEDSTCQAEAKKFPSVAVLAL